MANTLTIVLLATWALFATYLAWYVTSAKCNVYITFDDAKALWHIHKQNARCTRDKWRPISRKNGKIGGFVCDCGFKYTQKRPILSTKPKENPLRHRDQGAFSVLSY